MNYNIIFDDPNIGALANASLSFFSFNSSLYKLNNTANITITDITKTLFNKLKIGSKATVYFSGNGISSSCAMSVFSFQKEIGTGLADTLDISLISSQYFDDEVNTMVHSGSVSQILQDICTKHFDYNLNWTNSDDLVRYRYQTSERYQDFMLRILKYGMSKETPLFLYSDATGTLNLKSEYELRNNIPKHFLTIGITDSIKQKFDISETMSEVLMSSVVSNSENSKSASTITSKFSTTLFKAPNAFLTEKSSISIEDKNAQTFKLHEYSRDNGVQSFYASPTRTDFYGWELAPTDALAIAIRNNYIESHDRYSLSVSLNTVSSQLFCPGAIVWVVLPYNPTELSSTNAKVNCAEGQYLVQGVTYTYSDKRFTVDMVLSQVAY